MKVISRIVTILPLTICQAVANPERLNKNEAPSEWLRAFVFSVIINSLFNLDIISR